MLTKSKKVLLEKLYYDDNTGYTSAKKLWLVAHKQNPTISQTDVNQYLSTQPTYARHKQTPKPKPSIWDTWILVSYPGELVAVDTWFLGTGTKSQFPYALVAVDALSKYGAVSPMRILTAKNAANAMAKIIESFKFKIHSIFADKGAEFVGKPFRDFMKERDIKIVYTSGNNPSKTALAESFIRTLRIILGRVVTGGNHGWKAIAQTVDIYNHTPHSSIANRTPDSVTKANAAQILRYVIDRRRDSLGKLDLTTPPKFEKDDVVRLLELNKQGAFDKINLPRWSKELYRVYKVIPAMPRPRYILSDPSTGGILPGSYPEKSLQIRHNV